MVHPRLHDRLSADMLGETGPRRLSVRLGQIVPALIDAAASGRSWVADFEDEELVVSEDLYDVLLAYQHFRQR
ncbi:MAG TPA: hypothetical protein PLI18_10740 [Pirellulaceae bacterium]|nr:hypothetical protein [Pirellulaceae bacterium]